MPPLLNPHSPFLLDLLKCKSYTWLLIVLLHWTSSKLVHNVYQSNDHFLQFAVLIPLNGFIFRIVKKSVICNEIISFISSFRFITHVQLSPFYCLGLVHLIICQKSPPYFAPWLISLSEQPVHLHELLPSEMIFFVGLYVFWLYERPKEWELIPEYWLNICV